MMNYIKNTITLILVIISLFLIYGNAIADGGVFKLRDNSSWMLFKEDAQLCFINYQDETQKMLINVSLNDTFEEEKALWLFPIPAKPNEAQIDIINTAPVLSGSDFETEFRLKTTQYFKYLLATQIYPLPLIVATGRHLTGFFSKAGINVLEKIEKFGITTELISVKSKQNFIDYLKMHKVKFSDEFNKILDNYIGKDYIFVLSWLSNSKEYKNNKQFPIEVFVTFKTPKIFFPLKFTSIYGHLNISIFVYVINFVTPELFNNIISKTKVEYLIMPEYHTSDELSKFFFNNKNFKNLKYTKISISSEATNFTDDLWIEPNAPMKTSIQSIIYSNLDIFFIALLAILSSASSVFASSIIFFGYGPRYKSFMLLGLMNLFSIIGLTIAAYDINIDNLLTKKLPEIKRSTNFSKIILNSLIVILILAASTLSFTSYEFYSSNQNIILFSIYFIVISVCVLVWVTLYLKNHYIAIYITLFSIFFILLLMYSSDLLGLLSANPLVDYVF